MRTFAEAQAAAGVPDIDELTAKRDALYRDNARLFALFEDSAKQWDAARKVKLSVASLKAREELSGGKSTEAMIDAMAHADPDYQAFVDQGFVDRCRFVTVEAEVRTINDRINRGSAVIRRYEPT